jgi:2-amino-4-hydroxy-6-hydroxymethyldihydropteridine diphosphokinase/dihydropteroate synthase
MQGDRVGNLLAAIRGLAEANIKVGTTISQSTHPINHKYSYKLKTTQKIQVTQLSRLYESAPAYVTDQPAFLNAAATIETTLAPLDLLRSIKEIEENLGRDMQGQRWGPRPIDLDIIFFEDNEVSVGEKLIIPHPRWQERNFVIAPLADLDSTGIKTFSSETETEHNSSNSNTGSSSSTRESKNLSRRLKIAQQLWLSLGGERQLGTPDLRCVIPMGRLGLWSWQERAQVMGILNVTPDSFSDGGRHNTVDAAVTHAKEMIAHGADILDIGGQSTRPGAQLLTPQEEASRIIPVLRALSEDSSTKSVPLSVDTFYSQVAEAAVEAGATMVNDVSGGTLDPGMFRTVAKLGVPYVLMHMRGTPQTMQLKENTRYDDVCSDVASSLQKSAEQAVQAGIEPWRLILDPGLGFAKTTEGNFRLIAQLERLQGLLRPPLKGLPLLLGPSRKGFLGKVTGKSGASDAAERDWATVAAAALCVQQGANIIRAHNVAAVVDAVKVADAVRKEMVFV